MLTNTKIYTIIELGIKNERRCKSLENKRFMIKEMLMRNILTQTWLVHQLKRHGVQTDQTELSAVLNGRRNGRRKGNKATKIIITSLNILNDYEEKMGTNGFRSRGL